METKRTKHDAHRTHQKTQAIETNLRSIALLLLDTSWCEEEKSVVVRATRMLQGRAHARAPCQCSAAAVLLLAKLRALARASQSLAATRTRRLAKVPERLARLAAAAEEDGVVARGLAHRELVEGQALAAGLLDARARRVREAERAHRHLGDIQQAGVVHHGRDDDGRAVRALLERGRDARQADHRAVRAALHQALRHLRVERRLCAAREVLVQLDQQRVVRVSAVRVLAVVLLLVAHVKLVDRHLCFCFAAAALWVLLGSLREKRTDRDLSQKEWTRKQKNRIKKLPIKK